jgi:NADH:ubiquinone oxidoreductase subunit 2 (subunit N)
MTDPTAHCVRTKSMYSEQSMKALAMLKEAFKADGLVAATALITLLAGCLALIDAKWATAGLFLSVSAVNLAALREKLGPKSERAAKWTTGVVLAAGIALFGVACIYATGGDIALAIVSGLAGAGTLANAYFGRRRQSDAGRPKISI